MTMNTAKDKAGRPIPRAERVQTQMVYCDEKRPGAFPVQGSKHKGLHYMIVPAGEVPEGFRADVEKPAIELKPDDAPVKTTVETPVKKKKTKKKVS